MTTEKHETLDEALAAAQGDFGVIAKDKEVNAGPRKYSYADLAGVLSVVRPALAKHGLAITQRMRLDAEILMLCTELRGYGAALVSEMPIMAQLSNPQAVGSYLTYARRYALCSLVGVAADEDDDGEAAKSSQPDRKPPPRPAPRDNRPPDGPLPPRAAVPVDDPYGDVGEHTFAFGKMKLTAPEWLQAVSDWARDPGVDPVVLLAWWHSDKQKAERARFHRVKHELNTQLEAVKQEVLAHEKPAASNGKISPEQSMRAG